MNVKTETVWDHEYAAGVGLKQWPDEELIRWAARVPLPDDARILELGCGNGRNFALFADYHLWGVDSSAVAVALARNRGLCRDLDTRGFPPLHYDDGSFDAVYDVQCLQHVQQYDECLAEVSRVLKPDGLFFSVLWAYGDQREIFPDHPELIIRRTVHNRYCRAGLTVTRAEQVTRTYRDRQYDATWWVLDGIKTNQRKP